MSIKILCYGEILWDEYPEKRYIGGALFNFAAHLAKSGVSAYLYSAVGKDELGVQAAEMIRHYGIEYDYIYYSDKPTGRCVVELKEEKAPAYRLLTDVAYDDLPYKEDLKGQEFDAIAFGTLALRGENNLKTLEKILCDGSFKTRFCDLNLRPPFYDDSVVNFCLSHADILKLSEDEYEYLKGVYSIEGKDVLDFCKALSLKFTNLLTIIITLGENGSYCYNGKLFFCAAKKVKAVSAVGAGDSFGAVFLAEYLSGSSIVDCLKKATDRAAYVVSRFEGVPD